MPVFNLTLPRAVKALLEKFPAETLKPGDVLVTNDPWLCAGHLFDIAVVTPVFRNGALVALIGTVGHVGDIGGTKDSLRAREIYEEGIQIPPMKLYRGGRAERGPVPLIAENVRKSEQVLGDIHSFMAANALGAERLLAFMDEYGMHDLRALARWCRTAPRQAMREAIRALPDGVYRSEIWNNPLGERMTYPLKLTVQGDAIELDFDGAPPQLPQGGLNCTSQLHGGACDLPAEMHAQPACARQCGLLPAVHGEGAGGLDPQLHEARVGQPAHARRLVYRAEHLPRAAPSRAGAGAGLHRPAGRGQHLWPRRRTAPSMPTISSWAAGRVAPARRWQVGAAVSDLGRQHLDRTVRGARAGARVEKSFVTDSGGPGKHRGGSASGRACASCTMTVCRRWSRSIRKASASRWRVFTAVGRVAACAAWCSIRTATWCTIAAPANSSR